MMDQSEDIDADWTASELSVLRSAELDQPRGGSVERTLSALGVGAGVALGAGSSAAPPASPGGARAFPQRLLPFKFLGAALVVGGVVSLLVATGQHPTKTGSGLPRRIDPVPAAVTPEVNTARVVDAPIPTVPSMVDAPIPTVPRSALPLPVRPAASAKRNIGKAALAEEIRLIDEARARLRSGDAQGSLETLERYDRMVQHRGSMHAEATVVRIEALLATGDTAHAALLGQRFLASNPKSPYADSVTRILSRSR